MSDEHKLNQIDQILADFQKSKDEKAQQENQHTQPGSTPTVPALEELTPPAKSAASQDKAEDTQQNEKKKSKRDKTAPKEKKPLSPAEKKRLKAAAIVLGSILLIGLIVIIAISVNKNNTNAYLKPYEDKYGIKYPTGILEEYCDTYGKDQNIAGILTYTNDNPITVSKLSNKNMPYLDTNSEFTSFGFNTVIYGTKEQLGTLETAYGNAEACNRSGGKIEYNTLYEKQTWRVVGAFYTNTKPEDDNGYVFPYNVTQTMTAKSCRTYFARLASRFIYDTGYTLTRNDKLLTLSAESDYHKDFRFVVVCVMQENMPDEISAENNRHPQYPQVIFDEKKEKNTYAPFTHWYPEIFLKNSEKTSKQNIKDYTK